MTILGSEAMPMDPNEAAAFVDQVTAINRTPFLVGPPGVGKTDCIHQLGKKLGLPVFTRLLSQYEPSDFVGLPHIYDDAKGRKRTKFAVPEAFDFDRPHILFLDEFAQADVAVQRAASEIILQHSVGGIPLAAGTRVVAASNRRKDRAGVTDILGHNKSRLVTAQVSVNRDQWLAWGGANGVDLSVLSYISHRGESLLAKDTKGDAYPCPRTWVAVSDAVHGLAARVITDKMLPAIVAGSVGTIEGGAFLQFRETLEERPTMKEILQSPGSAKIPKKHPDQTQVATMVLSNLEGVSMQTGGIDSCAEYLGRLGREAVQAALKKSMQDAVAQTDGNKTKLIGEIKAMIDQAATI